MKQPKPSTIQEAPSVADVTRSDDRAGRVGKVDFTVRLGDRTTEQDEADRDARAGDQVATAVPLTTMVRLQRPEGEAPETDDDGPRMPFILPPAKVDAAMTAETERTKAEIAAARGELPDEDDAPADDEADDGADDEADDKAHEAVVPAAPAADADDDRDGEPVAASDPQVDADDTPSGPPEGLVIREVADLDEVAAEVAHLEAEESSRAGADELARLQAETDAAARAAAESLARAASFDHGELDALDADDAAAREARAVHDAADALPRSVAEVATAVVEAMRRTNAAHERHVEALELETARRCELLTAQAELDAELIRLHARREAHAIISAARARSGEHDTELVASDQLGEIGETFSRFAETIETTVASSPASPDHLRKS